jgi:hypothetical protein
MVVLGLANLLTDGTMLPQLFAQLFQSHSRFRARRLSPPAAGPADGGQSELLSVVPPGGLVSSGCAFDWNNRRALIRVSRRLNVDPDPDLWSHRRSARTRRELQRSDHPGCKGKGWQALTYFAKPIWARNDTTRIETIAAALRARNVARWRSRRSAALIEKGLSVFVANPRRIKAFRDAEGLTAMSGV